MYDSFHSAISKALLTEFYGAPKDLLSDFKRFHSILDAVIKTIDKNDITEIPRIQIYGGLKQFIKGGFTEVAKAGIGLFMKVPSFIK